MTQHRIVCISWVCALLTALGGAQAGAQPGRPSPVNPAATLPGQLQGIGIDQRLGEQIPLDLLFRDETGRSVRLGDYFGEKPVLLVLAYYECPMLCTQVINGVVTAMRPLTFTPGREFTVVTVSFNPRDTPALAAAKKQTYIEDFNRPGADAGWHFLTGSDDAIARLTEAVGFHYRYDEATQQYIHATGIMVATPAGRLARYFYGIDYSARDLRLGLVEASESRIGTPVDRILLACFHYDPATGKYSLLTLKLVRLGGIATVLGLAAFMFVSLRRDRRGVTTRLKADG